LQHSALDKIPLWVAETVEKAQLEGSLDRSDKFRPDPLLKAGQRSELADYKSSGYDRGHQAPAGNQTVDAERKDDTFYLSNMAPQMPALNQKIWNNLEARTRACTIEAGRTNQITGPIFWDPKEENPATANGLIEFKQIGPGRVAVPTHFFKILLVPDGANTRAIAFVMENRDYPKGPYDFSKYIQSIDWIIQKEIYVMRRYLLLATARPTAPRIGWCTTQIPDPARDALGGAHRECNASRGRPTARRTSGGPSRSACRSRHLRGRGTRASRACRGAGPSAPSAAARS